MAPADREVVDEISTRVWDLKCDLARGMYPDYDSHEVMMIPPNGIKLTEESILEHLDLEIGELEIKDNIVINGQSQWEWNFRL